jgi:hypothetical protein
MRFVVYFLSPVPLALFGLLASMLVLDGTASARELPVIAFASLVVGYLVMGLQSFLFALGMLWLERQGATRPTRCIVASCAGGLLGATAYCVDPTPSPATLFVFGFLGVSVGLAATILADLVGPVPTDEAPRHVGAQLFAVFVIPCVGGVVGEFTRDRWAEAARRSVLAGVSLGMTYDDVSRVAGQPHHDSRVVAFFLPTASVDVVWMYDCKDPAGADGLVVSVEFKQERVVTVSRRPIWRG